MYRENACRVLDQSCWLGPRLPRCTMPPHSQAVHRLCGVCCSLIAMFIARLAVNATRLCTCLPRAIAGSVGTVTTTDTAVHAATRRTARRARVVVTSYEESAHLRTVWCGAGARPVHSRNQPRGVVRVGQPRQASRLQPPPPRQGLHGVARLGPVARQAQSSHSHSRNHNQARAPQRHLSGKKA